MASRRVPRWRLAWILATGLLGAWGSICSLGYATYSRYTGLLGLALAIVVPVVGAAVWALMWWTPRRPHVLLAVYSLAIVSVIAASVVNQALLYRDGAGVWDGGVSNRYAPSNAESLFFVVFDASSVFAVLSAVLAAALALRIRRVAGDVTE